MYSIYDIKAKHHQRFPFQAGNDQMAIRAFADEINRQDSSANKHPEDFKLFKIAEYDIVDGKITQKEIEPTVLIDGLSVLERSE